MSPDGEVLDTWYGRSVICSATKLAYEHAQDMLDNPEKDWSEDELPPICQPWTAKTISQKVNMLQSLAVQLRARRFENGALRCEIFGVFFSSRSLKMRENILVLLSLYIF